MYQKLKVRLSLGGEFMGDNYFLLYTFMYGGKDFQLFPNIQSSFSSCSNRTTNFIWAHDYLKLRLKFSVSAVWLSID